VPERTRQRIGTVLYMLVVGAFFTALVAGVNAGLRSGIDANRRLKEIRGVFEALGVEIDPGLSAAGIDALKAERLREERRGDLAFFRALGEAGRPIGFVFPIGGPGYWGPVKGYVSLDPACERVTGIVFTRHTETPGLGARITEAPFRAQFVGKSVVPPPEGGPAIRLVPAGKSKDDRSVDAITGATGTSKAVEAFLNANLAAIRQAMAAERGGR
jgi:Na+-transporting NADH:ubiquinone oxidoreductase subunit C